MTESVFGHAIFEKARGLLRPVQTYISVQTYVAIASEREQLNLLHRLLLQVAY